MRGPAGKSGRLCNLRALPALARGQRRRPILRSGLTQRCRRSNPARTRGFEGLLCVLPAGTSPVAILPWGDRQEPDRQSVLNLVGVTSTHRHRPCLRRRWPDSRTKKCPTNVGEKFLRRRRGHRFTAGGTIVSHARPHDANVETPLRRPLLSAPGRHVARGLSPSASLSAARLDIVAGKVR